MDLLLPLLTLVVIWVVRRTLFIVRRDVVHISSGGDEEQRTKLSFREAYNQAKVELDRQIDNIIARYPNREAKYSLVRDRIYVVADRHFRNGRHRHLANISATLAWAIRSAIKPIGRFNSYPFEQLLNALDEGGVGSDEEPVSRQLVLAPAD